MNGLYADILDSRISKTSNKYLLVFPNEQLLQWYKRYLNREDIIYLNIKSSIVGLRYKKWLYIDQPLTKEMINYEMPKEVD